MGIRLTISFFCIDFLKNCILKYSSLAVLLMAEDDMAGRRHRLNGLESE